MEYKRTVTISREITPKLLHDLNTKYLGRRGICLNEDPNALTEYEIKILTQTLDKITLDLWEDGCFVFDREIISKMC